jgi:anti-anti-sigma factor
VLAGELTVQTEERAGAHTLILGGELDIATAPELVQSVMRLLERGMAAVVIDIGALTFIDTTGLRGILAAKDLCDRHGSALSVTIGQPQVQRAFEIAGVVDAQPFRDSTSGDPAREAHESKRRRFAEGVTQQYLRSSEG